jgi:putative tryptophan/tyrosine transport system substrate-binding protein
MRRREFITLLGGSAVAWPLAARAQQTGKARRIGLLMITAKSDPQAHADRDAFEKGLRALGWTPDKNIHLEYRWAAGDPNLLRKYAAELVGMAPDVILTEGTPGLAAALEATKSFPIIFASVTDPVGQGLVASLARPGGNATGFTAFEFSMGSKWVEVLRELVPSVKHIGLLFNRAMAPYSELYLQAIRAAAETFKIRCIRGCCGRRWPCSAYPYACTIFPATPSGKPEPQHVVPPPGEAPRAPRPP